MISLKKLLFEKSKYDPINNPDSMFSRGAMRNNSGGGLGGKKVMKVLGIENDKDESQRQLYDKNPISMMDLVMQMWTGDTPEDKENEVDRGKKNSSYKF